MKRAYLLGLIIVGLLACDDQTLEDVQDIDQGQDYYPMELGNEWVYELDSVLYDPESGFIRRDTNSYRVKYVVVDTFLGLDEALNYKIERSIWNEDIEEWEINDVWSTEMNDSRVIWREENLNYIKMTFPVSRSSSSWDGLSLIQSEMTEVIIREEVIDLFKFWGNFRYESVGDSDEILGKMYDEVATVLQADVDISLHRRFSTEKYARNVGLIYKYMEILDTQNQDVTIDIKERAEKGFILELRLVSFK